MGTLIEKTPSVYVKDLYIQAGLQAAAAQKLNETEHELDMKKQKLLKKDKTISELKNKSNEDISELQRELVAVRRALGTRPNVTGSLKVNIPWSGSVSPRTSYMLKTMKL